MTPQLLGEALQELQPGVRVWIHHMESGHETETWREIERYASRYQPGKLQRGRMLEI
jgi:hypothetical protein